MISRASRILLLAAVAQLCACATVRDFLIPPARLAVPSAQEAHASKAPMADVVLHVGRIAGADPEARSIAVRGNRIVSVGPSSQVESLLAPATQILRYSSSFVRAGAIATPVRLDAAAMLSDAVDLHIATQPAAVRGLLADARLDVRAAGDWVWGYGLRKELLRTMTAADIDASTGGVPVLLTSEDGQAALLNSAMMLLEPPSMAEFLLRDGGRAEGLAALAAWHRAPPLRQERLRPLLLQALTEMQQQGITEVHVVGGSHALVEALVMLEHDRRLPLRCVVFLDGELPEGRALLQTSDAPTKQGLATVMRPNIPSLVRVAGVQFWLDSSNDAGPPHLHYTDAQLEEWILAADHTGHQVALNAISDDATAQLARVLAALQRPATALPVRVEHASSFLPRGGPVPAALAVTAPLVPGSIADFVLWSRDPDAPPQPGQPRAEPLLSMVGGQPSILSFADRDM